MTTPSDTYYRLAPGAHVVRLDEGGVLFRTNSLAILIEGASSRWLADRVIPLLDGRRGLAQVAEALPNVEAEELRRHLDALVESRVLRREDHPLEPPAGDEAALEPLLNLVQDLGVDSAEARAALARARVAIFGLEGHGAHLAAILARSGVGGLVLVDPYPCQAGNLALMPAVGPEVLGRPRQDVVRDALRAQGGRTEFVTGGPEVTRESVAELADGCRILVGCFDKGFSATNHWINRASLAHGIPALYSESRGHAATIGPLVLPGQTACYMCYRMRRLACEDDFGQAMSYEEFLDRRKQPALHEHGTLPALPPLIAGLLGLEVIKSILSLGLPALAGKVLELDAFTLRTIEHTLLQKPDCSACCLEKKNGERFLPTLDELTGHDLPTGDVLAVASNLVGRRIGLIREFQSVPKDVGEPMRPYIFSARLSNHRFQGKDSDDQRICSGKGMTIEQARRSALGEAVERYGAGCWDASEVVYARRGDLDGEALDPRRLVLYRPDQIEELPYVAYREESVLGWVSARSLVSGRRVHVPALAVFLGYEIRSPDEYLFPVTSNGLAAGPTLRDAVLAAAFEVIERDALMIAWLNQLPGERLDPRSHRDRDILELCEAHARRGVDLELYRLPTDHPCHVCMALGVQLADGDGPAVVVGLGSELDVHLALRKALLEVAQIRPHLRRRLRQPDVRLRLAELVADPRLVSALQDHDLLYAARESVGAFDFLRRTQTVPLGKGPDCSVGPAEKLRILADHFRAEGGDLLYVNLTPHDLEGFGLHAARAIIPDFQPIDFGWKERRLGGEAALRATSATGVHSGPDDSRATQFRPTSDLLTRTERRDAVFRDRHPLAWMYHKNTGRWLYNLQSPPETASAVAPFKEDCTAPAVRLPAPQLPEMSLKDAIAGRYSCRRFAAEPLAVEDLATLLAAAYGIWGRGVLVDQEFLERPVPSGGGLYPLELYVLARHVTGLTSGVFHYAAISHAAEPVREFSLPERFLSELFLGQPYVAAAAAIVVLTAVVERSLWKYGDRGYRYILLEAGHAAQNLNLAATALGLGTFNLGGFFDADLAGLLGLDEEFEVPLYGIAIGMPASEDRMELRQPPSWGPGPAGPNQTHL